MYVIKLIQILFRKKKYFVWFFFNLSLILATLSRTFFFISCSFFMNCCNCILLMRCWLYSTHWQWFSRGITHIIWCDFDCLTYGGPNKLQTIFCAEFWYCFFEKSTWLTRLQLEVLWNEKRERKTYLLFGIIIISKI